MQDSEKSGVIQVGDMEYAVGMFWQTAEDPKSAKREAKLAAKQEVNPADLFVMREGFVAQWAIGWTSSGHKKDMPAAAACLAEALTGNWLGVFEVNGGWWFVASRRDAILPDGDMLYEDEDEPRTRFETEFVRGGWDRVFTPEEWGMGADATPLEELLEGHDEPKLSYLNDFFTRLPKTVKVAGVAAVVGVCIMGYVGVQVYEGIVAEQRAEEERLAAQQRAAMMARLEAERLEKERLAAARRLERVDRVWENAPLPSDWVVACATALDKLSVQVAGWDLQSIGCSGGGASARWSRGIGGSIASAQYSLNGIARPAIGASGEVMNASVPLQGLDARGAETAWKMPLIRENFLELFQGIDAGVTLEQVARPPKPPDEDLEAPRPRPPAHFTFRFASEVPPLAWASVFERFPGMIIDNIGFSIGGRNWQYSGRVYEDLTDEEVQQQNALLEGQS